jgi:ubiquinone biosynthesis protein Coq4
MWNKFEKNIIIREHVADALANYGKALPKRAFEYLKKSDVTNNNFELQYAMSRILHNQATFGNDFICSIFFNTDIIDHSFCIAHANKEIFEDPYWDELIDEWENSGNVDLEEQGKKTREKYEFFLTQDPIN